MVRNFFLIIYKILRDISYDRMRDNISKIDIYITFAKINIFTKYN